MTKKMLIDATHDEETRVAIVDGYKLLEFDYESKFRKPLKGSIFLAKVTRVEPSLQAAFVNFGGNRHGFLPFSEIHPDYFRIPIADREALLAEQQAAIEEMAREEEERSKRHAEEQTQDGDDEGMPGQAEDEENPQIETIEEIRDENPIEEIGGNAEGFGGDNSSQSEFGQDHEDEHIVAEGQPEDGGDDAHDLTEGDEQPHFDAPRDGEGQPEGEEGGPREGNGENGEENAEGGARPEGRRGRDGGRGGRFRRGRGGRGGGRHGRHRVAHSSRRVESFGGEEYDDDGGNDRFRFSLRRKYKIQEVIKRGQIMLVQVSKEERGNKGAAVSTYLSLPGRYCVLMPNSPRGGGVSRKIASYQDRARMREIVKDLEVPQGMSVIVRTAGVSREKAEIKRDLDYLSRLWDNIRELTLQSSAPSMVYEEADLIKRAVRDLYGKDIEDVVVAGKEGYETAHNFMKMLVPSHTKKVVEYLNEDMPLFSKFRVEEQIAEIGESQVTLPSGGYLVINQTEALVAIDVNSGKATKERHIEETALKTNLEAAGELARQLRLRDLGGLIVVDFIDMEDRRNNAKVERKMRDALSSDRARIQMGRISSFGLMELSRQRLNPSLTESQFEVCRHCKGVGRTRTCDATSIMVLRALEEEGIKRKAKQAIAHVSNDVAIYILNNKRKHMIELEERYGLAAMIRVDDTIGASSFRIEVIKGGGNQQSDAGDEEHPEDSPVENIERVSDEAQPGDNESRGRREFRDRPKRGDGEEGGRGRGRRGGRNRNRSRERGDRNPERSLDDDRFNVQPPINEGGEQNFVDNIANNFGDEHIDEDEDSRGNREEHNRSSHDFESGGRRERSNRGGRNHRGGRGGRDGGRGRDNNRGGGRNRDGGGFRDNRNFNQQRDDNVGHYAASPTFSEPVREAPAYEPETPVQKTAAVAETAKPKPRREEPKNEPQHARNFETVNEAPKEKKRGWWSKGE
jgi:ribonuclease E